MPIVLWSRLPWIPNAAIFAPPLILQESWRKVTFEKYVYYQDYSIEEKKQKVQGGRCIAYAKDNDTSVITSDKTKDLDRQQSNNDYKQGYKDCLNEVKSKGGG
jgi:hypothetical protein